MARLDPHIKVLDRRVHARARERGLDAVVYAPHFTPWPTIVERAERFSDDALTVVPAREIFTGPWHDRKHVLALDLEAPIPDFRDLAWTMAELGRQDACVIVPHPGFWTISLTAADVRRHREAIDAVEVYNPKFMPHHARRARAIAAAVDRPPVASSYAHLAGSVGTVSVELTGSAVSPADVIAAIRGGRLGSIDAPAPRRTAAAELAHLVYENSLKKLPRIRGASHLPTHPSQPRYRA